MNKRVPSLRALLFLSLLVAPAARAQRGVILVRHAEKEDASKDTVLSKAGEARARELARHLKDAGVTAIYTTQYQRTLLTAQPLAAALKITPVVFATDKGDDALVQLLKEKHHDDVVLIVGHSNTVPSLLKKLGVPAVVTIDESEFDNLFFVSPRPDGPPAFLRLHY
ncbi:MAG: phosphoglycerate mutase family protein [Thermoanaerobaculia bacterium]